MNRYELGYSVQSTVVSILEYFSRTSTAIRLFVLRQTEKGMAFGKELPILLPFCHCLDSASVLQSLDANARDLSPTTALIAASAAAATYLDAKFHISKDIGTISLNWRAERHYARAGTLSVMCSEWGPRSMSLRDWCATSQIQPTFNLLFLRRHCKEPLRCAGHLVTTCSVHMARDLCTGLPICGILP